MKNKQLNALGEFKDLKLFDEDGNNIYHFLTHSNGDWAKHTFNSKGKKLTFEKSDGFWCKCTYDLEGKQLTYENSDGYWSKNTYDLGGKELTFENSTGEKRGFNIPEYTMEELVEKIGHNFKIKK